MLPIRLSLRYFGLYSVFILMAGCTRNVECLRHYEHYGASLGFVGYALEEVDSVIVSRYGRNSAFSSLKGKDTLWLNDLLAIHDTLFCDSNHLFLFPEEYDYEVTVLTSNKTYRISDISYSSEDYTYSAYKKCPNGSAQYSGGIENITPDNGKVDGKEAEKFRPASNRFRAPFTQTFFLLRK